MFKDKIKVMATIADIHLGVKSITAEEFKHQLYERFIKPISEMMILDFITINGDISHLSLSFNSKYSEVYLWLFDSAVSIAKKKDATIIVIKGTLSHEYNQIDNIKFYKDDVDIYFIDEPSIIESKGLKIYCLPDIHIKDKKEEKALYKYPDNYFDLILGHGGVTETQFMKQETEYSISKNIIYNSKELLRICKGPILFGHIHQYMCIHGRIYYAGSFTRFIHGEELDKGFLMTVYIPELSKFKVERVINDLAFNFNTYTISYNMFDKYDINDLINKINKFIDTYKVDKLCLDVNYINTNENISKIYILRNYCSKSKVINKIKYKALSKKEIEINDAYEKEINEKNKYLIDPSIRFEHKLQRFIEEEYNIKLPIDKIETVLMSDELLTRKDG